MENAKVLIVEDEEDIKDLIHFHLYKQKYQVLEASNGKVALEIVKKEKPDLILLDIMIPEIDGLEVCKEIKRNNETKESRIIFLSAKGEEEDIIKGLELGADDYIPKPFSPKVLMARVQAVLRRTIISEKPISERVLSVSGIEIQDDKRKVSVDGELINLTETEYQILKCFISSPGQVFTRSQIVNNIRGDNHAVTDRSVDTQLVSLRKKMGPKGKLIETVWGVGYRFKESEA